MKVKLPIALKKALSYITESLRFVEGICVLGRDQIEPLPRIERVACFEQGLAQSSYTVWGAIRNSFLALEWFV